MKLSSKHIPNFITAVSETRLRSLMKKITARKGGHVKFFDFGYTPNGKVICWYNDEIDEYEITKEQLGLTGEGE